MSSCKKIITGLLSFVLVFGLAACGGGDTQPSSTPTDPPAVEQTQAPAAAEPAADTTPDAAPAEPEEAYTGEIGLSKYATPVTVTYPRTVDPNVRFAPGQDYTNNIWITEYRDVLGIDLQIAWSAEGSSGYDEKLQLQILAQDLPDMFECNAAQFIALVNGNMVEDLTDVFDQYAIDLLKENATMDDGVAMRQASVNDRLYAIPGGGVGAGAYEFLFIREDWRQQLGLPEPKTMDDVVNMARAFVENDPDGMSAYGFGISNQPFETYFTLRGFCDMFGAHPRQWVDVGGKLEYGLVQPEMKTVLATVNEWYNEGLLDPEFVVKDSYTMSGEAIAGRVGIVAGEWWLTTWPLPDGYKLKQDWRAYLIPFAPSNTERKYSAIGQLGARSVVRKGFSNPEALIKMVNLYQDRALSGLYPAEIYRTDGEFHFDGLAAFKSTMGPDRNGIAQANITKAVDTGDTSVLENEDEWSKYNSVMGYLNKVDEDNPDIFSTNFMWWRAYYGPESIFSLIRRMKEEELYKLDAYYDPPTASMSEIMGQLESRAAEVIINIISGAESVDYYDTFIAEWYANGGQQLTDEVNAWYQSK